MCYNGHRMPEGGDAVKTKHKFVPGQCAIYFPNSTTAWIGRVEYVGATTAFIAWGSGDNRKVKEIPLGLLSPLGGLVPSLGEFQLVKEKA